MGYQRRVHGIQQYLIISAMKSVMILFAIIAISCFTSTCEALPRVDEVDGSNVSDRFGLVWALIQKGNCVNSCNGQPCTNTCNVTYGFIIQRTVTYTCQQLAANTCTP